MAVCAEVWVDTSMGPVGTSTSFLRPVDLCVPHDQVVNVQTLDISVALTVGKQLTNEAYRFLGPPSLYFLKLFSLRFAWDSAVEVDVGDHALVVKNVLEVLLSFA